EVNGDRAVVVRGGGDVVHAVRVPVVRLEETRLVVDGDRPEPVHGHVPDGHRVLAVAWQTGERALVDRLVGRKTTPPRGRADQVVDRVDLVLAAEGGALRPGYRCTEPLRQLEDCRPRLVEAVLVPVGHHERLR